MHIFVVISAVVSDILCLTLFVGKLILFIIKSQNCFVQNKQISNIWSMLVVTKNRVCDNYVQVKAK